MKALGYLLVVLMWTVCGVSFVNIVHEKLVEYFDAKNPAQKAVARLSAMGTIRRVR